MIHEEIEVPIDFSRCTIQRGTLVIPAESKVGSNYKECKIRGCKGCRYLHTYKLPKQPWLRFRLWVRLWSLINPPEWIARISTVTCETGWRVPSLDWCDQETDMAHSCYKRKHYYAHRRMLEIKLGRPIREGLESKHSCDSQDAFEPNHLSEGTRSSNMRHTSRD